MLSIIIIALFLVMPFIWATIQILTLKSADKLAVFGGYFIGFNIFGFSLFNALAYLVQTDYMNRFQGWPDSPATIEIGLFFLSIALTALVALFQSNAFKSAICLIYAIYLLLSLINLLASGSNAHLPSNGLMAIYVTLMSIELIILIVLFHLLSRKG